MSSITNSLSKSDTTPEFNIPVNSNTNDAGLSKSGFFAGPRRITTITPFHGNLAFAMHTLFNRATLIKADDSLPPSADPMIQPEIDLDLLPQTRPDPEPIAPLLENDFKNPKFKDARKSEYVSHFLNKIGPNYHQRFHKVHAACADYLREIDYKYPVNPDLYGSKIAVALEKLKTTFEQQINYISFNFLMVMLDQEEINKVRNNFFNSPEMSKLREDLYASKKECVETTEAFLEIMVIKPNDEILIRIRKGLEILSNFELNPILDPINATVI